MDASLISNQSMTKMHVPRITVTPPLESSITMQSLVMTTILALLILVMLQKDANTLLSILQQRMQQAPTNAKSGSVPLTKVSTLKTSTVMTPTIAQLILATKPPDNALIPQSVAMTPTHALMTSAMLQLDALTSIILALMEMHAL
jgi:hypothetical protein